MKNGFASHHFTDDIGHRIPDGGQTFGRGFAICWQRGPLIEDGEKVEPNGAFVEDVIAAAADRIRHYQSETPFHCQENTDALDYLAKALDCLANRTKRRQEAGTLGTHKGS